MPLPSFLQRLRGQVTLAQPEAEQRPLSAADVEATRVRARRRLIGMVVLVGAGVIGFPWLFETQPRPMSPDVQMVRAGGHSEAVAGQQAQTTSKVAMIQVPVEVSEAAGETSAPQEPVREQVEGEGVQVASSPELVASGSSDHSSEPQVVKKADLEPKPKSARQPEPKPEPKPKIEPKSEPKAQLKPEPKAEAKVEPKLGKPADPEGTRFVVQFGAFSDGITAYEVRMKVERLGIKTYTQEVKTAQGTRTRVRVGPYDNRAEAEKVLARLRKAGLSGAVLTL